MNRTQLRSGERVTGEQIGPLTLQKNLDTTCQSYKVHVRIFTLDCIIMVVKNGDVLVIRLNITV